VAQLTDIESYIVEIVKAYILGVRLILIDDFTEDYPIDAYAAIGQVVERLKTRGISFIVSGSQWSNLSVFCDRIAILDRKQICKVVPSARKTGRWPKRVLLGGGEAHAFHTARQARADAPAALEARGLSGVYLKEPVLLRAPGRGRGAVRSQKARAGGAVRAGAAARPAPRGRHDRLWAALRIRPIRSFAWRSPISTWKGGS
jgi:hypothetical protein